MSNLGTAEPRQKPFRTPKPQRDRPSYQNDDYTLNKHLPFRGTKRRNDIYVTRKTNFLTQLEKCQKLLDTGEEELHIHGLGAVISRAVHLALQLKNKYHGSLELDVETGTERLVDDLIPEVAHAKPVMQTRSNSAIHIRVFRPVDPSVVTSS